MDLTYGLLTGLIPGLAAAPSWVLVALGGLIPAFITFNFVGLGPIIYVYAERKISGFMQDRLGPMRVGPYSPLPTQTVKSYFW